MKLNKSKIKAVMTDDQLEAVLTITIAEDMRDCNNAVCNYSRNFLHKKSYIFINELLTSKCLLHAMCSHTSFLNSCLFGSLHFP